MDAVLTRADDVLRPELKRDSRLIFVAVELARESETDNIGSVHDRLGTEHESHHLRLQSTTSPLAPA